ncbi:MAG TPA: hypothetical protein VGH38_10915 [Bryobacteraceae bacterium]|jgi:glycerol-3-phosphate cytidylyltransferase-like family protein
MDTRSKILVEGPAWPDFPRPLAVATGYFDVLRAEHARELWQARRASGAATLVAIVLRRPGELLSLRARAELVAALRAVDWVVCAGATGTDEYKTLRPDYVVRLEEGDERRSRELRERVVTTTTPAGTVREA